MFHWPAWPAWVTWAWPDCKGGNEYGVELSAISTTPRDQRSIPGSCIKGHAGLGRFLTCNWRNGAKNLPSQHDSLYPSQSSLACFTFSFSYNTYHHLAYSTKCLVFACYLLSVSTCCSVSWTGISVLVTDKCQVPGTKHGTEWLLNKSLTNAWINGGRCQRVEGQDQPQAPKDMGEQRRGVR